MQPQPLSGCGAPPCRNLFHRGGFADGFGSKLNRWRGRTNMPQQWRVIAARANAIQTVSTESGLQRIGGKAMLLKYELSRLQIEFQPCMAKMPTLMGLAFGRKHNVRFVNVKLVNRHAKGPPKSISLGGANGTSPQWRQNENRCIERGDLKCLPEYPVREPQQKCEFARQKLRSERRNFTPAALRKMHRTAEPRCSAHQRRSKRRCGRERKAKGGSRSLGSPPPKACESHIANAVNHCAAIPPHLFTGSFWCPLPILESPQSSP